jgi:group II intron reverse transcriptase/maturase
VLHAAATKMAGGWVIEVDIRKYFDTIDHKRLQEILCQRVRDGVILRLIGKWLNAGVMEEGVLHRNVSGTPQGGVISPLLANIYLHEVLDTWFDREVRPRLRGRCLLVRYADDAVMLFEHEDEARRVMAVLPKRFGRYGLALHPEKTRLVPFRRPDRAARDDRANAVPGSFDFLGFTIHWGVGLSGKWVVKTRTAKDRFRRALKDISRWCRHNLHAPLRVQQQALSWKLRGHYGYYGRTGNRERLWRLLWRVGRIWHRWLRRRSQRGRLDWDAMNRLLQAYPLATPSRLVRT